jgi:tetratricopeptide (TPR) repeat protein
VESLFARGSLYANEKKYPKAFEDLKGALRLDPKHQSCIDYTTKVLKILAASLLKSDKLDEAVKLCDCVLEIIPNNQNVLIMKKEILSYKEDSSTE